MKRSIRLIAGMVILFVIALVYLNQLQNEKVKPEHFRTLAIAEGKHYIIDNVNVITMVDDVILYNQSIVVESGILTKISDYKKADYGAGVEVIDGEGMYLMPGLFDMHVHTYQIQYLEAFLAYGVTLVRDMMGTDLHLKWKENIASGKILGPEMTVGTMLVDGENPTWPQSIIITDVSEVAPFIKQSKEQGYDFIKVYDKLTKAVFDEILLESKAMDIPVAGHIPYSVSAQYASLAGLLSSEHLLGHGLEYMNDAAIEASIAELVLSEMWICPTPYIYKYQMLERPCVMTKGRWLDTAWIEKKGANDGMHEKSTFLA